MRGRKLYLLLLLATGLSLLPLIASSEPGNNDCALTEEVTQSFVEPPDTSQIPFEPASYVVSPATSNTTFNINDKDFSKFIYHAPTANLHKENKKVQYISHAGTFCSCFTLSQLRRLNI